VIIVNYLYLHVVYSSSNGGDKMWPFDKSENKKELEKTKELEEENERLRNMITTCYYCVSDDMFGFGMKTETQIAIVESRLKDWSSLYGRTQLAYEKYNEYGPQLAEMQEKIDELTSYIAKMQKEYVEVDKLLVDD